MAKFKIKILTKKGSTKEEILSAPDKFVVFSMIKKRGENLLSISEVSSGKGFDFASLNKRFSTVKERDKILFAKNLGAMLKAGLSVSRAIFVIQKQTKSPKFKSILNDISENIKKGNSLNATLAKHPKVFSNIFVAMVKAGEESGSLTESLKVIAEQMEQNYAMKRKIKGALMYPGIILAAMVIIGALMLVFVVPTLTSTFKELDVDLPLSTQMIIFISDFMKDNTILFLFLILTIGGSFYAYIKTPRGKRNLDFVFLHMPIISGLVKEINAARTARTLSSLLSSGVEVVSSLSITREVLQNSYYKDFLKDAEEKVQKGIQLSEIFIQNEKIYPIFVGEMISVGEETGKLSDMLLQIAVFYEEDIDQKTKNMSTIIEPFLMIFIGAVVGFFALSMIAPTYSLVDSL